MSATEASVAIHRSRGTEPSGPDDLLPTREQLCLVRAATGPPSSIERHLREWRELVDLSGPIDGGSYRLIPMVYHRLQAHDIDDPNRGLFKGVYRRSMVEGSQVLHAINPALRALEGVGITPWVIKGAGLVLAGYYPTIASRPMADVDVAVDSARRLDAIAALRELGYVAVHGDLQMAQLHAGAFIGSDGHELDLHWHLLSHARGVRVDEFLTKTWVDAQLGGIRVRVPGPTGLLIATMVHGLVVNAEPPVRWLVDASRILDRHGDQVVWDDIADFAVQYRFVRRIEQALRLLAETTPHAAPEGFVESLASRRTPAVERLERRYLAMPNTSFRYAVLRVLLRYAGSDRRLRHVVPGLPRFVAGRWGVEHVYQVPRVGCRKLLRRLRYGSQP